MKTLISDWITSLLPNVAAECPILRVQRALKPCYLLLKPTKSDPRTMYWLPAPHLLYCTQPILITQEECAWHLLIIWYIRVDSVPTAWLQLLRRPGNIDNIPNSGIHKSRSAMVGVGNSTILPMISQKPKLKRLFLSRPDILASDTETIIQGHLKLTSVFFCAK